MARSTLVRGMFVEKKGFHWFAPAALSPSLPPGMKMIWYRAGLYYGRTRNPSK